MCIMLPEIFNLCFKLASCQCIVSWIGMLKYYNQITNEYKTLGRNKPLKVLSVLQHLRKGFHKDLLCYLEITAKAHTSVFATLISLFLFILLYPLCMLLLIFIVIYATYHRYTIKQLQSGRHFSCLKMRIKWQKNPLHPQ